MRFLASEEELFAHDKVVEECIPCLNLARDSLLSCDLLEVTKRIRDLVDMCILQQRKKQMLPNERNQDLLSHLGAHQAVIRFLFCLLTLSPSSSHQYSLSGYLKQCQRLSLILSFD